MSVPSDLFEAAACGLARTDGNGVFLHVNRTLCEWVGYSAQELCGARRLQDLLTMGGRIFHQTHWHPLLQIQGSVSEVKLDVVHRDGQALPMILNAIRRSAEGDFVHDVALFIARDRDKYERELLHSRKRLEVLVAEATRLQHESSSRAIFSEQMVGIVSHDLRNPLSTIQMSSSLLSRGDATPNQLRIIGRITRSAERATRLIADLLDFTQARIGTGIAIAKEPIDLAAVLSDVVEELTSAYPGRVLRYAHEGGMRCAADADRISQLVGNLVSNAIAYGQLDGPITIRSHTSDSACSISVHNLGEPIPADKQASIFEPMVRGGDAGHSYRSVGLGLFIVAEIARGHGGSVSVESGAQGTTFTVNFPGTSHSTSQPS